MTASPGDVLDKQILHGAAQRVVADPLDRFPPLIAYRCLSDAHHVLARAAAVRLRQGAPAVTEMLTMPRRGFGPRPVEVLSPVSRTVYGALVNRLSDSLPERSRQRGAWSAHRRFGQEGDHRHVVELDFASCYELVDHADLHQELLLRSFDQPVVDALAALLRGVGRHGRGLPQMLADSDLLADAYLSIIDRRLQRSGYQLHRFADDIRVLADDWDQANQIIEIAADHGRSLGLILSSEKTRVLRKDVVGQADEESASLLHTRLDQARVDLTEWVEIEDPYDTEAVTELEPSESEALRTAYESLVQDWHAEFRTSRDDPAAPVTRGMVNHLNKALVELGEHDTPVAVDVLVDLVFQDPARLEYVCQYLLARQERGGEDDLVAARLAELTAMGRQSPWAKLWLLHVADRVDEVPDEVATWVRHQLTDPHETVRAEAAWTLARRGLLATEDLERCYPDATELTAPALAAAAAKQDQVAPANGSEVLQRSMVEAVRTDGPLNREAYAWATR